MKQLYSLGCDLPSNHTHHLDSLFVFHPPSRTVSDLSPARYPHRSIQIVFRLYQPPIEILAEFDINAPRCVYDGKYGRYDASFALL